MTIKIGDKLPDSMFKIMTKEGAKDISTKEISAKRTIAIFAVPGAYTPTCTTKHLPGFANAHEQIKAKGIDEIYCLSVNDIFVMSAWGKDCAATPQITMLADGNGDFTKAVGLEMDAQGHGMGIRSQRYLMIAQDGVVTKLFIEQPGAFEVSSAEYLIKNLA